jgi:hypothetical protein
MVRLLQKVPKMLNIFISKKKENHLNGTLLNMNIFNKSIA